MQELTCSLTSPYCVALHYIHSLSSLSSQLSLFYNLYIRESKERTCPNPKLLREDQNETSKVQKKKSRRRVDIHKGTDIHTYTENICVEGICTICIYEKRESFGMKSIFFVLLSSASAAGKKDFLVVCWSWKSLLFPWFPQSDKYFPSLRAESLTPVSPQYK